MIVKPELVVTGANGLPQGGSDGQLLFKSGTGDYEARWSDAPKTAESTTVTLYSDDWTESDGVYTQTVDCPIVASDSSIVELGLQTTGDISADDELLDGWVVVSGSGVVITQGDGTLTFSVPDEITVNLPVSVGVS